MTSSYPFLTSRILPSQVQKLLPYYLLVLAVFLVYGNIYDNAFLFDDEYLIEKNTYLHSWHSLRSIFVTHLSAGAYQKGFFYRPLQNVFYLIVYQLAGPKPFAFQILNVTLHAANACLLYQIGCRLRFKTGAVFCATLIWALHPLHVEAVTYISATADLLYSFFCLLGIVVLLPDASVRKFYLAAPLMILALLSKETAIIFPLLAMSCLYYSNNERLNYKTYIRTWPLWLVAVSYVALHSYVIPFHSDSLLSTDPISKQYAAHVSLRIFTALASLIAYIRLTLWPTDLHMDRDFPVYLDPWFWDVFAGGFLVIGVMAQILWGQGKRGLALSWGFMWFTAAHILQTGIFIPLNALFLEHWMYLPSSGLFLGIAQSLAPKRPDPKWGLIAVSISCLLAVMLGWCTYEQNKIWHDPFIFYKNILDHGEVSYRARNNLAIAYAKSGDYAKAMEQLQMSLKENPDIEAETHQNIAYLLSLSHDGVDHTADEIKELERAIAIDPRLPLAYEGLASIYESRGDREKARFYQNKADAIRKSLAP